MNTSIFCTELNAKLNDRIKWGTISVTQDPNSPTATIFWRGIETETDTEIYLKYKFYLRDAMDSNMTVDDLSSYLVDKFAENYEKFIESRKKDKGE